MLTKDAAEGVIVNIEDVSYLALVSSEQICAFSVACCSPWSPSQARQAPDSVQEHDAVTLAFLASQLVLASCHSRCINLDMLGFS